MGLPFQLGMVSLADQKQKCEHLRPGWWESGRGRKQGEGKGERQGVNGLTDPGAQRRGPGHQSSPLVLWGASCGFPATGSQLRPVPWHRGQFRFPLPLSASVLFLPPGFSAPAPLPTPLSGATSDLAGKPVSLGAEGGAAEGGRGLLRRYLGSCTPKGVKHP